MDVGKGGALFLLRMTHILCFHHQVRLKCTILRDFVTVRENDCSENIGISRDMTSLLK